jgi:hypothetical protein
MGVDVRSMRAAIAAVVFSATCGGTLVDTSVAAAPSPENRQPLSARSTVIVPALENASSVNASDPAFRPPSHSSAQPSVSRGLAGTSSRRSQRPLLSDLTPRHGSTRGGTKVVVLGKHLTDHTRVLFCHTRAASVTRKSTRIVAFAPALNPASGSCRVRLKTGQLTSDRAIRFRYRQADGQDPLSVTVGPDDVSMLQVNSHLTITAEPGTAGAQTATLTYSPDRAQTGALVDGVDVQLAGDVHLSTGQPEKPLRFTWTFQNPLPPGAGASFYTGNPETEAVQELPTVISEDRRTATAEVPTLSFKSFVTWVDTKVETFVGGLLSTRGDRPTCDGPVPSWVDDAVFVDEDQTGDNPMLACVGHDPANPQILVVKITNNRGHGLALDVPVPWSWIYFTDLDGLDANLVKLFSLLQNVAVPRIVLAPGQQVHFGFSEADLAERTSFTIQGHVDAGATAYGLAVKLLEEVLGENVTGAPVLAAGMLAKCFVDTATETPSTSAAAVIRSVYDHLSCMVDIGGWATLIREALPVDDYRLYDSMLFHDLTKVKRVASKFNAYVRVFSMAQQLFELTASVASASETFALSVWRTVGPPPPCFTWQEPDIYIDQGGAVSVPKNGNAIDQGGIADFSGYIDWDADGANPEPLTQSMTVTQVFAHAGDYVFTVVGEGHLSPSGRLCRDNAVYRVHVRSATRQVSVYNKVTNGATEMREDVPAYLSTVTRNYCRRDGCMVAGTDMNTGRVITAYCTVIGDRTTNGQDNSSIDDNNPGLYTSTRWYGIQWSAGVRGYLSEVWVNPNDRGGLGLPPC